MMPYQGTHILGAYFDQPTDPAQPEEESRKGAARNAKFET
jgi:hypothetical protein